MLSVRAIARLTLIFIAFTCGVAYGQDQSPPVVETIPEETFPITEEPFNNRQPEASKKRGNRGGFGYRGESRGPSYSAIWYPATQVSNQTTNFGYVRQDLRLGAPLWRHGDDMLLLTTSVRNSLFFTDAILPDSGRKFPSELWEVKFGLNFIHRFHNGWSAGLMPNIGSASDKPFHSADELNLGMLAFLNIPVRNDRDPRRQERHRPTRPRGALHVAGRFLKTFLRMITQFLTR